MNGAAHRNYTIGHTGGTLTITLEGRNGNAQIRFEDTGMGLGEDELKRLFVPFNSKFKKCAGIEFEIIQNK